VGAGAGLAAVGATVRHTEVSDDRADYYRGQAEVCRQAAEDARKRDKAGWLKLVSQWLKLAEQSEELTTENIGPQTPHKSVTNRNYSHRMTTSNAWAVTLCCPHCGRTGTGTVSEEGLDRQAERRLRVDSLSSGFVAVELRPGAGQDIRCVTCNSSALK
jgi:hypothetical protein